MILRRLAAVAVAAAALVLLPAAAASAHPLGNFTINHYNGLASQPASADRLRRHRRGRASNTPAARRGAGFGRRRVRPERVHSLCRPAHRLRRRTSGRLAALGIVVRLPAGSGGARHQQARVPAQRASRPDVALDGRARRPLSRRPHRVARDHSSGTGDRAVRFPRPRDQRQRRAAFVPECSVELAARRAKRPAGCCTGPVRRRRRHPGHRRAWLDDEGGRLVYQPPRRPGRPR